MYDLHANDLPEPIVAKNENGDDAPPEIPPDNSDSLKWRCWKCESIQVSEEKCKPCNFAMSDYDGEMFDLLVLPEDEPPLREPADAEVNDNQNQPPEEAVEEQKEPQVAENQEE